MSEVVKMHKLHNDKYICEVISENLPYGDIHIVGCDISKENYFFQFSHNFNAYIITFWSVFSKGDLVTHILTHFSINRVNCFDFGRGYIEN